tara:strand:- start:1224 stop:1655 length:432 start_codon:yes stop_codon:yes gene_type:complete
MATRALINIVERQEGRSFSKTLPSTAIHTQIYKGYDGYPEGLGVTLANYLDGYEIVNGISYDMQGPIANGIGCLAAQLVSYIKNEPGDIYLRPPSDIDFEDYVYYVWVKEKEEIMISIFDCEDEQCIFVGTSSGLIYEYSQNK